MPFEEAVREIKYVAEAANESLSIREIMKNKLHMSSREITRCKQFEDGVLVRRTGSDAFLPTMIRDPLHEGDELIVRIYENNDAADEIFPSDSEIDIVYEDEDLIVLNKNGDTVVHPSYAHYTDSLSNALAGYYKRTGQKHLIRAIGRLDRETSGLVIFAKSRHSAAVLSDQRGIMSRRKEYLAIASGFFEEGEGTVEAPIERRDDSRMVREVRPDGKEAVTHFTVEKQYRDFALIRLKLDTGRTHQIRVHMSYIGHPLVGDTLYAPLGADSFGISRAALHAQKLELTQPITGEKIVLEVPLPDDMAALLDEK